jgi:hypothetical protein
MLEKKEEGENMNFSFAKVQSMNHIYFLFSTKVTMLLIKATSVVWILAHQLFIRSSDKNHLEDLVVKALSLSLLALQKMNNQ